MQTLNVPSLANSSPNINRSNPDTHKSKSLKSRWRKKEKISSFPPKGINGMIHSSFTTEELSNALKSGSPNAVCSQKTRSQNMKSNSFGIDPFSCHLKTRKEEDTDFTRLWCVFQQPRIKFFTTKEDTEPLETLSFSSVAKVIRKSPTDLCFTIKTTAESYIECKAETEEECQNCISYLKDPPGQLKKPRKKRRRKLLEMSNGAQEESCYYKSNCKDLGDIRLLFSTKFTAREGEDGFVLTAGTLEDIIKWCIIHSTRPKERHWDTSFLFLSYYWICNLETLSEKIQSIWKEWKRQGFPRGLTKQIVSERLQNFVFHLIESPVMKDFAQTIGIRNKLKKSLFLSKSALQFFDSAEIPKEIVSAEKEQESGDFGITKAIDFSVDEIASQITLDDAELYNKIGIREFMDANWEKKETGPGVCALVDRYNKISRWVSFSIMDTEDPKEQLDTYKKCVALAHRLHEIQNYNGCTAVIGGLSDASIGRLKNISTNISEESVRRLNTLKEIYSPVNGYRQYRDLRLTPACIPSLAVYLRDLTLSLDGNLVYLDEPAGIINFERMAMIGSRVIELHEINSTFYNTKLTCNNTLRHYLAQIDPPNPDELYELSLKMEPPRGKGAEEEVNNLKVDNEKLKLEILEMRQEEKQRRLMQQQVLEQIQNSNSKASTTVRALLESITEGTSSSSEQLILLKLQLQAALDLCITHRELNPAKK